MPKKPLYILLICQFLILAVAMGSYLLGRGNAFSKVYTADELTLEAGEIAEDGSFVKEDRHGTDDAFLSLTKLPSSAISPASRVSSSAVYTLEKALPLPKR